MNTNDNIINDIVNDIAKRMKENSQEELIAKYLRENPDAKLIVDKHVKTSNLYYCELHNNDRYCSSMINDEILDELLKNEDIKNKIIFYDKDEM